MMSQFLKEMCSAQRLIPYTSHQGQIQYNECWNLYNGHKEALQNKS